MAEMFELDDIPSAFTPGDDSNKDKSKINDKHIPNFDFDSYPDLNN